MNLVTYILILTVMVLIFFVVTIWRNWDLFFERRRKDTRKTKTDIECGVDGCNKRSKYRKGDIVTGLTFVCENHKDIIVGSPIIDAKQEKKKMSKREIRLREKITNLTKSFGIKNYNNSALWTYINELIDLKKGGGK